MSSKEKRIGIVGVGRGLGAVRQRRIHLLEGAGQQAQHVQAAVEQAGAGGAVVLDVIVPPYDEDAGRACHYFEAVSLRGGVFELREIPEPADFECLGAVYTGLRPE